MTTTTTKERPILFSGAMVRAILDGRKTQTRRVVKHHLSTGPCDIRDVGNGPEIYGAGGIWLPLKCPYGSVGDRLWVRETWAPTTQGGSCSPSQATYACFPDGSQKFKNGEYYDQRSCNGNWPSGWKWRPSIHMPRWASRLDLEQTDIRVERLQDISEEDAIAEGMSQDLCAKVFLESAGKVRWEYMRWLTSIEEYDNYEGDFCPSCAKEVLNSKKWTDRFGQQIDGPGEGYEIDGWDEHFESDTVRWCDKCGVLLCHSLTKYGVERELWVECDNGDASLYPARGEDAAVLAELAGGIGDLRDEHKGRLAKVGFSTLWDSINGARSGCAWKGNPWVWVLSFRRMEA